jgi:hypothetical protein
MVAVLRHPPYLPHLAPVDSRLFPKLRFALKGLHLQSIKEVQDAVTRVLNNIWKKAFLEGIKKVYKSVSTSVNLDGVHADEQQFFMFF